MESLTFTYIAVAAAVVGMAFFLLAVQIDKRYREDLHARVTMIRFMIAGLTITSAGGLLDLIGNAAAGAVGSAIAIVPFVVLYGCAASMVADNLRFAQFRSETGRAVTASRKTVGRHLVLARSMAGCAALIIAAFVVQIVVGVLAV